MENDEKINNSNFQRLLELYEGELKREADERAKQAIIDSEQAEISAEKELKKAEQEKKEHEILGNKNQAEAELKIIEEKELRIFREQVLKSLNEISQKNESQNFAKLGSTLQKVEENTKPIESYENSGFYANVTIIFFMWFICPMLLTFKFLDWFFNWM